MAFAGDANIAARLMRDIQRDLNLTPAQAAGVVGNFAHESDGFRTLQERNPVVPGSRGGFGFAQWTGPRRRNFEEFARSNGLDPNSYEANYGFFLHEIQTDPYERAQFDKVREASTAEEAAQIVSENYLRPGVPHLNSRIENASLMMDLPQGGNALDAIDQVAPRAASHNAISYGPELGQVPLSALPMPRPDPRPQQAPDPNATHNAFIKRYPFQMDSMPYPVEAAGIRTDPRIAFHPTTFDQRFTAPKPVDRPTRNELEADRLTVVPGRSLGFSPAPKFPTGPARTPMPNADMPRRTAPDARTFAPAKASPTPPVRTGMPNADMPRRVAPDPRPVAQPTQQTNTRVAPTVQTAGYTPMPSDAFDRISQQMRVANQAEGLGSYPTQMALQNFSPRPAPAPAPTPAPVSGPTRNQLMAEALMDPLPPSSAAPVPATMPANLRGDPLAGIVPDGTPLPQPPAMPVMTATAPLQPAPPPTVAQGLLGPLLGALKQPTFTFQNLEVMGRPQQDRRNDPPRQPGLSIYGRKFDRKTNKWITPGQRDLGKVGFTMHRNTGTVF